MGIGSPVIQLPAIKVASRNSDGMLDLITVMKWDLHLATLAGSNNAARALSTDSLTKKKWRSH